MAKLSAHIIQLYYYSLSDQLSDVQLEEWERFQHYYPKQARYLDTLNAIELATLFHNRSPQAQDAITQEILELINQRLNHPIERTVPQVHRVHFLKTAWFRYAAAIILFIGIGAAGYFTLTRNDNTAIVQHEKPTNHAPAANILPGSNKAVLTLSDGRKIELDSAASGTITDQHLSIENNNGQLKYGSSGLVAYNTMTTPRGGQYQVILPDGTKVWLNAASSITYPTAFTSNNRTVNIEGEAYFEVAKDAKKPFIVKTYEDEITVLGTAFNINAYKDERTIKTSLVEGSVKINQLFLQPGQAYENGKITKTNIEQDIAWKNGVFDFNNLHLEEVLRQLSRWYEIDIDYQPGIDDVIFIGEAQRNLNLSQVLKILSKMEVNYELEGKKLIVKP